MFSTRKHRRKTEICPNCHTILKPEDNFCPNCGQENHDLKIPLGHLIYEFVESITHFDTKMWETLKAIVRKPGKITKDFVEGKRVRYVHPVRMYVFVSFLFFLLLGYLSDKGVHSVLGDIDVKKEKQVEGKKKNVEEAFGKLTTDGVVINKNQYEGLKRVPYDSLQKIYPILIQQSIAKGLKNVAGVTDSTWQLTLNEQIKDVEIGKNDTLVLEEVNSEYVLKTKSKYDKKIHYHVENDIVMDSITTFSIIHYTPAQLDTFFVNRSEEYREGGKIRKWLIRQTTLQSTRFVVADKLGTTELEAKNMMAKILKYVSMVMFLLMPIVAFLLLMVYYRQRRFYYEHLIFSIQIHSIMFMILMVMMVSTYIFYNQIGLITTVGMLLIMTYFYKSLRTVYQQGRLKTFLKFIFLTGMYTFIFSTLLGVASLFGFLSF